jgi:hypothetical protein
MDGVESDDLGAVEIGPAQTGAPALRRDSLCKNDLDRLRFST